MTSTAPCSCAAIATVLDWIAWTVTRSPSAAKKPRDCARNSPMLVTAGTAATVRLGFSTRLAVPACAVPEAQPARVARASPAQPASTPRRGTGPAAAGLVASTRLIISRMELND